MIKAIAYPRPGEKVTADLIKKLIDFIRANTPLPGPNVRTTRTNHGTHICIDSVKLKSSTRFPLPFEVRFDGSLNGGSGGWKIYLPTEHLLQYKGEYIDPIDGVTTIEDANGDATAWFEFDEIDLSASHVWLVVSVDDSGSASGPTVSAKFAASAGNGESDVSICIAEISYTAATSNAPASAGVRQSVVGALHLGHGEAGDPVSVSADGPFSPVYDDEGEDPEVVTGFQNCYWQNGGVTVLMSDQSMPGSSGFIALKAGATPSTTGTATLYCYATLAALQAAQRDTDYFIVPLYRVAASKITLDMRRMPVVYTFEML